METIIVLAVLAVVVGLAIRSLWKDRKEGKCSCGSNCGACGCDCHCDK